MFLQNSVEVFILAEQLFCLLLQLRDNLLVSFTLEVVLLIFVFKNPVESLYLLLQRQHLLTVLLLLYWCCWVGRLYAFLFVLFLLVLAQDVLQIAHLEQQLLAGTGLGLPLRALRRLLVVVGDLGEALLLSATDQRVIGLVVDGHHLGVLHASDGLQVDLALLLQGKGVPALGLTGYGYALDALCGVKGECRVPVVQELVQLRVRVWHSHGVPAVWRQHAHILARNARRLLGRGRGTLQAVAEVTLHGHIVGTHGDGGVVLVLVDGADGGWTGLQLVLRVEALGLREAVARGGGGRVHRGETLGRGRVVVPAELRGVVVE